MTELSLHVICLFAVFLVGGSLTRRSLTHRFSTSARESDRLEGNRKDDLLILVLLLSSAGWLQGYKVAKYKIQGRSSTQLTTIPRFSECVVDSPRALVLNGSG